MSNDLDDDLDFGDPPVPRPRPAPSSTSRVVGESVDLVSHLPRGCVASDRHGRAVIVHPDGGYHRVGGSIIHVQIDSHSFGPYTVEVMGLDDAACIAWTRDSFDKPAPTYEATGGFNATGIGIGSGPPAWTITGTTHAAALLVHAASGHCCTMTFATDDGSEETIQFTRLEIRSIVDHNGVPLYGGIAAAMVDAVVEGASENET